MGAIIFLMILVVACAALSVTNKPVSNSDLASVIPLAAQVFSVGENVANKISTMNALNGYPVNPTYAVYKQFSDTTCTKLDQVVSFLQNTCLIGTSGSATFTCGRQHKSSSYAQSYLCLHIFLVDGFATETRYTDTACQNFATASSFSTTCTPFGSDLAFQVVSCSTTAYNYGEGEFFVNA